MSLNPPVESDAFALWQQHPVTIAFFQFMTDKKREISEQWANGSFTDDTIDKTIQLNSAAIGGATMLDELIHLTVEDLNND